MYKIINKANDEDSGFDINEIERSIQDTITALERFVFDKDIPKRENKEKQ